MKWLLKGVRQHVSDGDARRTPEVSNGATMLDVQGLTKLYGDFPAVQALTFQVGPGEVLGLVGPNGAGKTTTLRSVAGILTPTSGTITVAGHSLAREALEAKAALAFIPDEPQ